MWKKKRKRTFAKERKKRKLRNILLLLFIIVSIFGAYHFFMLFISSRATFMSPKATKLSVPIKDKNIEAIKKELEKTHISFTSISVRNTGYEVILTQGIIVLFSSGKPIAPQVSSLQLILSHFTIDGEKISRVDLEFDKPIITM